MWAWEMYFVKDQKYLTAANSVTSGKVLSQPETQFPHQQKEANDSCPTFSDV